MFAAYRTNEGQTWVMPVVRTAEKALAADETLDKEYLPVLGLESFTTTATKLLLGADSPAIKENRVRNESFCLNHEY
jgi:aspartate aminotransferase